MSQPQYVEVVMKHDGEHIHHGPFKKGDTVKVSLEEAGQLVGGAKKLADYAPKGKKAE